MSKIFLYTFAVALAVIGFVVWRGFVNTSGNHVVPVGKIGKVRIQKMDDSASLAIVDFNVRNDSDRDMIVRSLDLAVNMPDGSKVEGSIVSASDAAKVFAAYPTLGEQYNQGMKERDKVAPHESLDRMTISRFDMPWTEMEKRKNISLTVEDITGTTLRMEAK